MNRKITPLVLILTALAVVPVASAGPAENPGLYLTFFEANYSFALGTRIDKCILCHTAPTGGARNPYGRNYWENGLNFTIIEQDDPDGDGFTNIDEIDARTFPGEAIDFPQFGVGLTADAPAKTMVTGISAIYTLAIIGLIAIYLKI